MARLDRFLVTKAWEVLFGGARQSLLPKPTSDHHPILLEGGACPVRGPLPFRFKNMWLKEEGFKYPVNDWWCSYEIRGTGSYMLAEKLKGLKAQLKAWNKNSFGRVEVKKETLKKVKEWDDLDVHRPLSVREREQKM